MDIRLGFTKVFALLFLFFANSFAVVSPDDPTYVLRAGTKIHLKMDAGISSEISKRNDTFIAFVADPVSKNGVVVLQEGVVIEGRVLNALPSGITGKGGRLELDFETILFATGAKRSIDGKLADPLKPGSRQGWQIASIVGGTLGGTLIGALTGKSRGAAIGAGVGSAAGTGTAVLIKGEKVGIRTGEQFYMVLEKDVVLPYNEI
jgi:hypothetical protein